MGMVVVKPQLAFPIEQRHERREKGRWESGGP